MNVIVSYRYTRGFMGWGRESFISIARARILRKDQIIFVLFHLADFASLVECFTTFKFSYGICIRETYQ